MDVYDDCCRHDKRLAGMDFKDKKLYLPLQAADMVAYRLRKTTEEAVKHGPIESPSELDLRLFFKRINERRAALKMFIGE